MDIMRQSACLVVNPITVCSYGLLFKCMMRGRGSGLNLNDDPGVKLSLDACLWLSPLWLNLRWLSVSHEPFTFFIISLFFCDDALH